MTVSVSPRGTAPTLASAVQAAKAPQPTNDVTGQRQPDTNETPPPAAAATPPAEKKEDFLSPKFAALARQEKQIRAGIQKLKDERAAFETEKSARLNGYIPKDKLKSDPLSAFQDAGTSYDEIAQALLNSPQGQVDPTVRALQQQVQQLTSQLSQFTKKHEDTQTTAYKQAVDTIRHKVTGLVDSPEFETVKALDQVEAVVALIEETFKSDGYVMSEEEALREVEEHLVEEAIRMAGLEKVKKRLAPPPAETNPPAQQQPQSSQQPQLKTLTNAVNSTTPQRFTEKQRRDRAILAAQGKLTN